MGSRKTKIIRFILFILVFLVLLFVADRILAQKNGIDKSVTLNKSAGDPRCLYSLTDNSLDVVVLGASQAFTSFNPLRAFHKQGFTSLMMAGPFARYNVSLYYCREMFKTQSPKAVLIELGPIKAYEIDHQNFLLQEIVNMNPSVQKFEAAKSIYPDSFYMQMAAFIPVLAFHDRWQEVTSFDVDYWFTEDYLKGFLPVFKVCENPVMSMDKDDGYGFAPNTVEQLTELVNYIEASGSEAILYRAPSTTWTGNNHENAKALAEQLGVQYIDFNLFYEDIGFDPDTDFYDESHVNMWGSEPLTDWLSAYLQLEFDFEDKRGTAAFSDWERDYQRYEKEIENRLEKEALKG